MNAPREQVQTTPAAEPAVLTADELLARYKSGSLTALYSEYYDILCSLAAMPLNPRQKPRMSGVPSPLEEYAPLVSLHFKPKLVMYGNALVQGGPVCHSSPFATATAIRNPDLLVENAGWASLMSFSLQEPFQFGLQVPKPGTIKSRFVCILIGTDDAIAICAADAWVDEEYTEDAGGRCRLPKEWRHECRPSVHSFEANLGAIVRACVNAGAKVAVVTPPPLGEDLGDAVEEGLAKSPYSVMQELTSAIHRIASVECCSVLPLFECCVHRLKRLRREPQCWTPSRSQAWLKFNMLFRKEHFERERVILPWDQCGPPENRPDLCHDLVHFNERGAALCSTLLQAWLDSMADDS